MVSTIIFILLLVLTGAGLSLGVFYYFYPDKVVYRRVKKHHWETAQKDAEFRKWLELEIQTQLNRTRRLGMIIIIMEAVWLVVILGLWQKIRGV